MGVPRFSRQDPPELATLTIELMGHSSKKKKKIARILSQAKGGNSAGTRLESLHLPMQT